MNVSLLESLWITLIEVIIALFLSTAISTFLGWTCTRSYRTTKIFKFVFQLLVYSVAVFPTIILMLIPKYKMPTLAITVFVCGLAFITLYAIIGFEQARQNQNQWYLAIPNISLGMRMSLLLSWTALQIEALISNKGIGFFLWDAYNSGNTGGFTLAVFGAVTLAFLLDQFIDLSSLFLSKALNSNPNGHSTS
jgi:ABC-type nitrate/sulfonate/bicarbonate transport system permease component